MKEKKIVIDIDDKGKINAETFGIHGVECLQELDKLLKDIALETKIEKGDVAGSRGSADGRRRRRRDESIRDGLTGGQQPCRE